MRTARRPTVKVGSRLAAHATASAAGETAAGCANPWRRRADPLQSGNTAAQSVLREV
jgi:hypothetical protein